MKNKIILIIVIIIVLIIVGIVALRIGFDGQGEDSWIKNEKGIYVKHGNPSKTPDFVLQQRQLISNAKNLCEQEKEKTELISQCLGTIGNYAIDLVHIPRNEIDNQVENQCSEYREGKIDNFLELDKNCEIVRIV